MKKLLFLSVGVCACLVLGACTSLIKSKNGSDQLIRVENEPVGCEFLYKLESEVSVYDTDDARRFLENRIVDQVRRGNTYWITSMRTRPNEWVIFGPERTYVLTANVYDCPAAGITTATNAPSKTPDPSSAYMYGNVY